eukprot:CAMPEP_0176183352 /NCGR_PEP_ID=MMETSP0121_2-20121125/243_1 /TAXON_ID=160619 /ORGANISM="Kryptoperidinium foliaceum, Strain CCMP 1326" /LENGTH=33 /DNA_ID= /DNA_START= /DNA_END= /DNA_ORIENTATION=
MKNDPSLPLESRIPSKFSRSRDQPGMELQRASI